MVRKTAATYCSTHAHVRALAKGSLRNHHTIGGHFSRCSMGIPQYFSVTYAEARRKFLEAARAGGAAIESYVDPNAKGANGEELVTDVARFGNMDGEALFLTCAGTHGNEGFCGSGCQIGLIKEGIINARPQSATVLLVHAVNPY